VLPKVEVTKFIEDNRAQFDALKGGLESVKNKKDGLDAIVDEIKRFYEKMDFSDIASKYYKKFDANNREKILEEIFSGTYKLIEAFNEKTRQIEAEAKKVGEVSTGLNARNKGDDKNKKEFE
jgi:TPP-dependent trihydroxycyclohexane-1,2-dione (THcHDO) dehydratase